MTTNQTAAALSEINKRLDVIVERMSWLIKAEQRFKVGQRVEWSRQARRQGFPTRKVAQKGTVKAIQGFSVVVKLDGLKQVNSYHHSFFNAVSGEKLF